MTLLASVVVVKLESSKGRGETVSNDFLESTGYSGAGEVWRSPFFRKSERPLRSKASLLMFTMDLDRAR